MEPGLRDIRIYQGDDYSHTVTVTTDGTTPLNITGRTYTAQMRRLVDDTLVLTFTCTVPVGTDGQIVFTAAKALTVALSESTCRWALHENAGGVEETILAGSATIIQRVVH